MALCVFYLISVIGVAMSMHFCGGKLSQVSFEKSASCGNCKINKVVDKDDCCKDTGVHIKIDDSHKAANKVELPQNFSIALFYGIVVPELLKKVLPNRLSIIVNKAPPLSSLFSLHILNCVFRN